MQRFTTLILILSTVFIPQFATARTVYREQIESQSNRLTEIAVWSGYGLNLNFIPTGEIIKKVWLDDPSRITLSFDGQLCQSDANCSYQGATVIHLKQIEAINFPNIPQSATGATLLTVITEGESGRNLYQFKVRPAYGTPDYTTVNIKPLPPANPAPALKPPLPLSENLSRRNEAQTLANLIHAGLVVAIRNGEIQRRSPKWEQLQQAMTFLREGATLQEAASESNLDVSRLTELMMWGQEG
ncbi:MAG: hypothetical protein GVY17_00475 [Cyanobacteria bacterium]|jgi:hypothetical protein|nr:hypothetical protein [Cyanobacteria bacterium GSL.Bin21]